MPLRMTTRQSRNTKISPVTKIGDRVSKLPYIAEKLNMRVQEVISLLAKHQFSPLKMKKKLYVSVDIMGYVLRKEINNIRTVDRSEIIALINELKAESKAFQIRHGIPTLNVILWNEEVR
jgi:hypothetical protein